jgi:hypothetical protein
VRAGVTPDVRAQRLVPSLQGYAALRAGDMGPRSDSMVDAPMT